MGPDHLLLWEAICGTAHDRVQPVQHMGAPVLRQDQEIQCPGHLLLSQVQGLAAIGTQKRHLKLDGTGDNMSTCPTRCSLTLVFFDAYCQNSLCSHLDGNCTITL